MKRELPIFKIRGTAFYVDVQKDELRQVTDPTNIISLADTRYHYPSNSYIIHYNPTTKRLGGRDAKRIIMPGLTQQDPIGMARAYRKRIENVRTAKDFDVIIDEDLIQKRYNGHTPYLKIRDHRFYVEWYSDTLQPTYMPENKGMFFPDMEDWMTKDGKCFQIPYHPGTFEFRNLDLKNILEVPQDIFLIEFPVPEILDPVGYCWIKKEGLHFLHEHVRFNPPKYAWEAKELSWDVIGLNEIIIANKARLNTDKQQRQLPPNDPSEKRKGIT